MDDEAKARLIQQAPRLVPPKTSPKITDEAKIFSRKPPKDVEVERRKREFYQAIISALKKRGWN
jgi:hypothetical protein